MTPASAASPDAWDLSWSRDDVAEVHRRISPYIRRTPIVPLDAPLGPGSAGAKEDAFFLKVEAFQKTGSFKVRGALNALQSLSPQQRSRGVVTASSGSHGKAVAYAARLLNIRATVVLPENPNPAKRKAIEDYGARVILEPGTSVAQLRKAQELADTEGLVFVHSFNTPEIFLGQGTVGLEILQDFPDVQRIVVPIGGGGLISGILIALKEQRPDIEVIGVQPEGCCPHYLSLKEGRIVSLDQSRTMAEGLTCTQPEEPTFSIIRRYADDVVVVSEEEIAHAVRTLLEYGRLMAEPSGAAATAALLAGKAPLDGRPTVAVVSGGNMDWSRLVEVVHFSQGN